MGVLYNVPSIDHNEFSEWQDKDNLKSLVMREGSTERTTKVLKLYEGQDVSPVEDEFFFHL